MTKQNEIREFVNNSNVLSTSAHETCTLVSVQNNTVVTSSLIVADYFGKNHKDVLRAIKSLDCSGVFNQRNFAPVEYIDKKGERRPMYYLTRDGFTFLAMGFTGKVAAQFKEAYINAFNEMEKLLQESNSTKYAETLLLKQVTAFNQYIKSDIANGRSAFGLAYGPLLEKGAELTYIKNRGLEKNLKSLFSQISSIYKDGFLFTSIAIAKRRELQKYIDDKYNREM